MSNISFVESTQLIIIHRKLEFGKGIIQSALWLFSFRLKK